MSVYFMLGKYSSEAIKGIAAERTDKIIDLIKKSGGKVNSMYVLLGEYDLVFIVDFPDHKEAMKASVELNKMTNISFTTSPEASFDTL